MNRLLLFWVSYLSLISCCVVVVFIVKLLLFCFEILVVVKNNINVCSVK